jgi:transcriptional regulator with XRE-family HTH domain
MPVKTKRTTPPPRIEYPDLATFFAESGQSQQHVASVLGISQVALSRFAAGVRVPRPEIAYRIASYCRIPLDSFTRVYLRKHVRLPGVV